MWQARALQRAGGIPYFLLSLTEGLRATIGSGKSAMDEVPHNVAETIRQRVATLPAAAQALMAAAAVAGREVSRLSVIALGMLAGFSEDEVIGALDRACQARLLTEVGAEAYAFTHDLVREVVAADLTAARPLAGG